MVRLLLLALLVAQVAIVSACHEDDEPRSSAPSPSTADSLIEFARSPNEKTWEAVPFAETVQLGLAGDLVVERSAEELRDPASWRLAVSLFRGRSATVSALELIATEQGMLRQSEGRHRHCVSPPVPPPASVARHRRIWVQPAAPDGCLDWWTVDAFVNEDGQIEAVTLDLFEP